MGKGLPRSLAAAKGDKAVKVKRIKVKDKSLTVAAAGAGVGFGTAPIDDFPAGNILFLGAVANLQFTSADADIGATFDGDYSIGSAPDADGSLSGAEADIIASTALGAATAKASPIVRGANATAAMLDNTDGSLEVNLNLLIDAANIADASSAAFVVNGDVWIAYAILGDD